MKQYSYNIDGTRYDVRIESLRDGRAEVTVNGVALDVEILSGTLTEGQLPDVAEAAAAAPAPAVPAATPAAPAAAPAA
ncbi:MAG: acetyl-CoA carboxylase biotin carboxyl carrier protein subunit, partial [Bacteroidaceae bacterium]|nr:acetyl-CoA carboxylase biotin carboxyl carrier protein subunit [Bacteroidaceae bacterium]